MKQHAKKETGWVSVYKDDDSTLVLGTVHGTKEKAV